nr:MAG TPA: hypothetical protein [Caudoviricetes sp.]DAY72493.1 MAG TPA: hypothetical protein [Caudoviricetes sp.]
MIPFTYKEKNKAFLQGSSEYFLQFLLFLQKNII